MKKMMLTLCLMSMTNLYANVAEIEQNEPNKKMLEVILTNKSEVLNVSADDTTLLKILEKAQEENLPLNVTTNEAENKEIINAEIEDAEKNITDVTPSEVLTPMTSYTPSNVVSVETANAIFKTLFKRTNWFVECFNRAHLWAKQMLDNQGVQSMKQYIFYTKKFRRDISGKWWFHVAPMIQVNDQRFVMDKEFTKAPVTDTDWENIFTKKLRAKGIKNYRCKVIQNMKEFYEKANQEKEYCNILTTSMYYWEPNDMSRLDKTGVQKTEFINRELKIAIKDVLDNWVPVYKRHKVQ
jgi:hypothetical protein